jgi:tol-pal system protein YbgF
MKPRDKRSIKFMLLLIFFMSFCWGCTTTNNLAPLQQSVQAIHHQVQIIDERLRLVERQVGATTEKGEGRVPSLADVNARVEELRVEMGSLKGRLEEQEQKLRITDYSSKPTVQPTQPVPTTPPPPSTPPSPTPPPSAPPPSAPIAAPTKESPEDSLYDKGLKLFQKGQYTPARKDFQSFLLESPNSSLADNAQYWIGECYFEENRYREAIDAYQRLLDRYPQGNKAPYGMLRQGAAFERLGDPTAARILYERIVENYPNTPQAQIAQRKLEQL